MDNIQRAVAAEWDEVPEPVMGRDALEYSPFLANDPNVTTLSISHVIDERLRMDADLLRRVVQRAHKYPYLEWALVGPTKLKTTIQPPPTKGRLASAPMPGKATVFFEFDFARNRLDISTSAQIGPTYCHYFIQCAARETLPFLIELKKDETKRARVANEGLYVQVL